MHLEDIVSTTPLICVDEQFPFVTRCYSLRIMMQKKKLLLSELPCVMTNKLSLLVYKAYDIKVVDS